MTLLELYALTDAQRFPCAYPEGEQGRPSTLFWSDFTVAEVLGKKALEDTWTKVGDINKLQPAVLTELIVVLNHKLWQFHDMGRMSSPMYDLYEKWYNQARKRAVSPSNGWSQEDRDHFFYVTD